MNDIIVITGGANGLGLELVKQSLKKGLTVCNIDKDTEIMRKLDKFVVCKIRQNKRFEGFTKF